MYDWLARIYRSWLGTLGVLIVCIVSAALANWTSAAIFIISLFVAFYLAIWGVVVSKPGTWKKSKLESTQESDAQSPSGTLREVNEVSLSNNLEDKWAANVEVEPSPAPRWSKDGRIRLIDSWGSREARLRDVLARELSDEDRIAIADEAHVARHRIKKANSPDNAWQFLMMRADDDGVFWELLQAAANRSPIVASAIDKYQHGI